MSPWQRRIGDALRHDTLVLAVLTLAIFVAMSLLLSTRFLNTYNIQSMLFSAPELGMLTIAMMLSMIPGGIDLSIISIANLAAVCAALFFRYVAATTGIEVGELGIGVTALGWLLALLIGAAAGALNGVLITRLRVTSILATIGTSQLLFGLSQVLTGGPAVQGFPGGWTMLGNSAPLGIPLPAIVFVAVLLVVAAALGRTAPGVSLTYVGTNMRAANFSGIRTARLVFLTFVASGVIASLAGILITARTNAVRADYGSSYLLMSVLVAVLAGTNPAGGRAATFGILLALPALTFLSSGFQMLRFSNFLVELIWGVFLLIVLTIQFLRMRGSQTRL